MYPRLYVCMYAYGPAKSPKLAKYFFQRLMVSGSFARESSSGLPTRVLASERDHSLQCAAPSSLIKTESCYKYTAIWKDSEFPLAAFSFQRQGRLTGRHPEACSSPVCSVW